MNPLKCHSCPAEFATVKKLMRHKRDVHSGFIECRYCTFRTSAGRRGRLVEHERQHECQWSSCRSRESCTYKRHGSSARTGAHYHQHKSDPRPPSSTTSRHRSPSARPPRSRSPHHQRVPSRGRSPTRRIPSPRKPQCSPSPIPSTPGHSSHHSSTSSSDSQSSSLTDGDSSDLDSSVEPVMLSDEQTPHTTVHGPSPVATSSPASPVHLHPLMTAFPSPGTLYDAINTGSDDPRTRFLGSPSAYHRSIPSARVLHEMRIDARHRPTTIKYFAREFGATEMVETASLDNGQVYQLSATYFPTPRLRETNSVAIQCKLDD